MAARDGIAIDGVVRLEVNDCLDELATKLRRWRLWAHPDRRGARAGHRHRGAKYFSLDHAFSFGNTADLADELAELVRTGIKTATSMLLWELEAECRPPWSVGDRATVLDSAGRPVCVIETTELEVKPFNAVDARFPYDYGEGDRSLNWWARTMMTYYSEVAAQLHRQPAEDMPLICERFRLVN